MVPNKAVGDLTEDDRKYVYAYDYVGRRVRKLAYAWDEDEWSATASTDERFIYFGRRLLLTLDGLDGNAILRKLAWGPEHGLGDPMSRLLTIKDYANDPNVPDSRLAYYDGEGNLGQLIDLGSSVLVATYDTNATGRVVPCWYNPEGLEDCDNCNPCPLDYRLIHDNGPEPGCLCARPGISGCPGGDCLPARSCGPGRCPGDSGNGELCSAGLTSTMGNALAPQLGSSDANATGGYGGVPPAGSCASGDAPSPAKKKCANGETETGPVPEDTPDGYCVCTKEAGNCTADDYREARRKVHGYYAMKAVCVTLDCPCVCVARIKVQGVLKKQIDPPPGECKPGHSYCCVKYCKVKRLGNCFCPCQELEDWGPLPR